MPRHAQASLTAPTITTQPVRPTPARNGHVRARVLSTFEDEGETTACPLCCEELDNTEREHYPCPCGYQVCLFCLQRLQQEYGNRCPGCRTLYGTDRDEWERQAEARAKELQAERPQRSPSAASKPSPRGPDASPSPGVSPAPAADGGERRATGETPAASTAQPGTSRSQTPRDSADDSDWPSLSTFQGRPRAANSSAAVPVHPAGQAAADNGSHQPIQSVNLQAPQVAVVRQPPGLPLPVTVQSVVNGTRTSLETVIDLSPTSGQLHTYVAKDLNPLIEQLKSLQTGDKVARKGMIGAASAAQKQPSASVAPFSAAKRRAGASAAPSNVAPPGLERRPTTTNSNHPTRHAQPASASKLWPQPATADISTRQDSLSTAFNNPPPSSSAFGNSTVNASPAAPSAASSHTLAAPPGLALPPGLQQANTSAPLPKSQGSFNSTPTLAPMTSVPTGGASATELLPASSTSNVLHELFPREKSGRLGWFASPAPAFEGNMHQLWDSSAPLSTLVHPTLATTRNRRPLYARNPDNVPPTISEEDGCGAPPGLERESARDPVVATLSRKLGGRAAEIGANVQ